MKPSGAHTHSSSGSSLPAALAVIAVAAIAVAVAGPVVDAVAALLRAVILIAAAVTAVVIAALIALAVYRVRHPRPCARGRSSRFSLDDLRADLRWLTYFIQLRQALGMEPVRIKFGPAEHEDLAQLPGKFSYYVGADDAVWQCLGEKETGACAFTESDSASELARTGVEIDKPLSFILRPIMTDARDTMRSARLPPGDYCLRLFLSGSGACERASSPHSTGGALPRCPQGRAWFASAGIVLLPGR